MHIDTLNMHYAQTHTDTEHMYAHPESQKTIQGDPTIFTSLHSGTDTQLVPGILGADTVHVL